MRTHEQTLKGEFWLPGSSKRLAGTLTISESGELGLEVRGTFEDRTVDAFNTTTGYSRIVGLVEGPGAVTLEHCRFAGSHHESTGLWRFNYAPSLALLRAEFLPGEALFFDSLSFATDGLELWHQQTGLSGALSFSPLGASFTYSHPDPITLWQSAGLSLELRGTITLPAAPYAHGIQLEPKSQLFLKSETPKDISELLSVARSFVNLLALAIGEVVSITRVSAFTNALVHEVGSPRQPVEILAYHESPVFDPTPPMIDRHQMLFTYEDLNGNSQQVFDAWYLLSQKVQPAIYLYLDARLGQHRFINSRFLNLTQALESYHRRTSDRKKHSQEDFDRVRSQMIDAVEPDFRTWVRGKTLHLNELTLRERLRELLAPFEVHLAVASEASMLIGRIVEVRNYFTHWDPEGKGKADTDLVELCYRMEALFQLLILRAIGFSPEQIAQVVSRCRPLRERLCWQREL